MTEKQKRVQRAKEMFLSGYNCAQSTAAPFHDLVGMDEETVIKASSVFGGGVARMRNVCGVVSGIALLIGLSSDVDVSDPEAKANMYKQAQDIIKPFTDENETVICSELLEEFEKNPLSEQPYKDKPCLKLVEDGAKILCGYFAIE